MREIPNMTFSARALLLVSALFLSLTGPASGQNAMSQTTPDSQLLSSTAFLEGHPDLRNRKQAERWYTQGQKQRALEHYRRAARFADKHSQARIAEMLWAGDGVEPDRALAYVWMDLAAERGYRAFLARRESFWSQLDEAERTRALREGIEIFGTFGDEAAQPRMERALTKARRKVAGSRVGFVGSGMVFSPGPARGVGGGRPGMTGGAFEQTLRNGESFTTERFFDPAYWNPKMYWEWQLHLHTLTEHGTVEVGPLEAKSSPMESR
jgi:hypothetical protein